MFIGRLSSHHIVALIMTFLKILYHWTSLNYHRWSSLIVSGSEILPVPVRVAASPFASSRLALCLATRRALRPKTKGDCKGLQCSSRYYMILCVHYVFNMIMLLRLIVYRCNCAWGKTNPFGATVHLDVSHSATLHLVPRCSKMFQHPQHRSLGSSQLWALYARSLYPSA